MSVFTKFLAALLIFLCAYVNSYAQWCVPVVTQNFSHGIFEFIIDGSPPISRSSSPNELYVYTGMSTTLERGAGYEVSFDQNYGVFCSLTNLFIWIDFNKDFDFDDSGELVISIMNASGGHHHASFTVPTDAVLDSTRMRIASKMTVSCGHIAPSPCNIPPDPIGWHGEFEDYTVMIVNPTVITPVSGETPVSFELAQNYPNPFNPATKIRFSVPANDERKGNLFVSLNIFNALGEKVETMVSKQLGAGVYEVDWDGTNYPSGVYYYKLQAGNYSDTKIMALLK